MANPTKTQLAYLDDLLSRDVGSNHQLLSYYLKLILSNRPLEIEIPGLPREEGLLRLSPEQAWQQIEVWNQKAGLPMGDRGSRKIRASRLLNYLDLIQGNTREAATNFQSIKESASAKILENTNPTTEGGKELKKVINLRNLQIDIHNRQVLGQLATELEQTSFIKRFAGDHPTQIALAGLFAANAANLRNSNLPKLAVAEEIVKLVQLNAGRTSGINNAAHLAYSSAAQKTELGEIGKVIDDFVAKNYKSETDFIENARNLSSRSHILTVADIPDLLDLVAPTAPATTRQSLSRALQTAVIESTNNYVNGKNILSYAFGLAGLPEKEADNLVSLAPLLEEIRVVELHNTLSGDIKENDPRIQNTLKLASDIGTSAHIPWLSQKDIDARLIFLQEKYKTQDLAGALISELDLKENANFEKISEINHYLSDQKQYRYYHKSINENVLFSLREKIGKARGSISSVTAPIDRFSQKVGKTIWAVDDFIHSPFKYVVDQWAKIEEKIPILNPGKFLYDKINGGQLWVATKILEWSDSLVGRGHWASGILTHVSDFTRGFISEGGNWSGANFVFVQKKWGDLLDWGAKKAKFESFQAVKAKIGSSLWSGFSKLAPGIAEKMSSGSLGKLVTSLVAGELTAGTSLLLQVGFMVVGEALKGIWNFIVNKNGFRDKIINNLPAIISAASIGLAAIPGIIIGGLVAGGSALIGAIGSIISLLFSSVFLPALIAVGSILAGVFLLYQLFSMTSNIDSGVAQLATSILCNDGSSTSTGPTNKVASCASCLVKYLTQCYGQSVTGTRIQSKGISCIISSIINSGSADAIEQSAVYYSTLQCIGFAKAAAICGGGDLEGKAVASAYIHEATPGYRFAGGAGSCQPGDFGLIDGAVGHIFVVGSNNNATITAIDANFVCPGCVSANNPIPADKVAGCLKKN